VGRGEVIDLRDLYLFLKDNPDIKVGIDVWWKYPDKSVSSNFFQDVPIHELRNVVMTPHIAGFAEEIKLNVIEHALNNILRFIKGEKILNVVNRKEYL